MRQVGAALIGLLLLNPSLEAQESHLLVVTGLGGEPEYSDAFHEWAIKMIDAAENKYGVPAGNVIYLAEKPERDPARIKGPSTKAGIEQSFTDLGSRVKPHDTLLVLLIGHGSSQAGDSRLNLPGPDITPVELARLLDRLPAAQVAVVGAFSASGDLLKAAAGRGRIVVTATKSGMERNETVFGRYFVEAFSGDGADADKDGRVSLLEAFDYARREVARYYEKENRLLTEHAVMADGADAGAEAQKSGAGRAKTFFIGAPAGTARAAADPRLGALQAERDAIQQRIEALKTRKASMDQAAYEAELERLLLDLAAKDRALRGGIAKESPK
jgi:hypothetical protein